MNTLIKETVACLSSREKRELFKMLSLSESIFSKELIDSAVLDKVVVYLHSLLLRSFGTPQRGIPYFSRCILANRGKTDKVIQCLFVYPSDDMEYATNMYVVNHEIQFYFNDFNDKIIITPKKLFSGKLDEKIIKAFEDDIESWVYDNKTYQIDKNISDYE
jgi:hypothetical protein